MPNLTFSLKRALPSDFWEPLPNKNGDLPDINKYLEFGDNCIFECVGGVSEYFHYLLTSFSFDQNVLSPNKLKNQKVFGFVFPT